MRVLDIRSDVEVPLLWILQNMLWVHALGARSDSAYQWFVWLHNAHFCLLNFSDVPLSCCSTAHFVFFKRTYKKLFTPMWISSFCFTKKTSTQFWSMLWEARELSKRRVSRGVCWLWALKHPSKSPVHHTMWFNTTTRGKNSWCPLAAGMPYSNMPSLHNTMWQVFTTQEQQHFEAQCTSQS